MNLVLNDNVFESIDQKQEDKALRFQFKIRSPVFAPALKWNISTGLQCGLEEYQTHNIENRWIHKWQGQTAWHLLPFLSCQLSASHKMRRFFKADIGYQQVRIKPAVILSPNRKIKIRLEYALSHFNHQQDQLFDYRGDGFRIISNFRLNDRFALSGFFEKNNLEFDRLAYEENDSLFFAATQSLQKDHLMRFGIWMELYVNMLVQLGITWETNHSNSVGFNYTKPQFQLIVGRKLVKTWAVNFLMKLAWKDYHDPFAPYWPVQPDTEVEENNQIWLSVTKDFSNKIALKNQIGWYRNESPLRNRYYAKHACLLGLAYRF